jgi:hypothetical protein
MTPRDPIQRLALRAMRTFARGVRLARPVFILAPPRSGSTLLFEQLAVTGRFHYYPVENDWVWWRLFPPDRLSEPSDLVTTADVGGRKDDLRRALQNQLLGGYRNRFAGAERLRRLASLVLCPDRPLLDKTIANCFHLDALHHVFPDARYVFLVREPRANISSMIEGWAQPERFGKPMLRPQLERATGRAIDHWCYPAPPGWAAVVHRPLPEICGWSWRRHMEAALDFLERTGIDPVHVRYEDLVTSPAETLAEVARCLRVRVNAATARRWRELPLSRTTVSRPEADKWRRLHGEAIRALRPAIVDTARRIGYDLPDEA